MEMEELNKRMKSAGFVGAVEAAELVGRTSGGNIHELLMGHKVSCLELATSTDKKHRRRFYFELELSNVPTKRDPPTYSNGHGNAEILEALNKLAGRMDAIEKAITE